MKKIIIGLIVLCCIGETSAQVKADTVKLINPKSSSIIVFGDPQNYTKFTYNQPILELMTSWVEDNIDNLHIKTLLCTGDLVDQNSTLFPPTPRHGNITSSEQWTFVARAFGRLDGKLPYCLAAGNHDYGYNRPAENSFTNYPKYFPVEKNSCWRNCIVGNFPNRNGEISLENAAYEFELPNWGKILVISAEFAPRDEVLNWAKELAAKESYQKHKIIFLTHSYIDWGDNAKLKETTNYKITPANAGKAIWEKLIYPSKNIRLVICGHVANANEKLCDNVGFRTDKNQFGKDVSQMMFNPQAIGGGWSGNGGDGWLRILEFQPDGKTISVRTYSPLFGYSQKTKSMAYDTEPCNQFNFEIK